RKILGNNAHIVIDAESQVAWSGAEGIIERVMKVPGVVGATPVVYGQVMISSRSNLNGVVVRGVDPSTINDVIDLEKNIEVGRFEYMVDPEELRHLPADEVIGIGPGGEQWTKGPEMPRLEDDLDPAVKAALDLAPPLRP